VRIRINWGVVPIAEEGYERRSLIILKRGLKEWR